MEGILRLQQSTTALPSRAGGRWTMLHSLGNARWFACWLIDEANGSLGNERTRATQDHQVIDTEVGFM